MENELGQFLLSSKIMTEQRISQRPWCRGTPKIVGFWGLPHNWDRAEGQFEKSHLVSSSKERNKHTKYSLLGSSQHPGVANFCLFCFKSFKIPITKLLSLNDLYSTQRSITLKHEKNMCVIENRLLATVLHQSVVYNLGFKKESSEQCRCHVRTTAVIMVIFRHWLH